MWEETIDMEHAYNRNRNLWIGLGIIALLLFFALPTFGAFRGFEGYGYGYGPHPFGFGAFPFFFGIGMFVRLLVFGGIVFFLLRLFRRRSFHLDYEDTPTHELSSIEILNRRYAAGEITREQYAEMRRTLEGTTQA